LTNAMSAFDINKIEPVNILLVDDRSENLLSMGELLKSPGYNIVEASSGQEALRQLLQKSFAVILLDVQMPDLDGFETARLVRQRECTRHTPIIFVTAVGKSPDAVKRGYDLGAVDYLLKPVEPVFLKAKVSVFAELHRKRIIEGKTRVLLAQHTAELKRSNRELEQFAYVASHDLQEPLRKVKSFAELLAKRYKGHMDDKADEFIDYIVDGTERMQNLIQALLRYARVTTQGNPMRKTDFNHILDQALSTIQLKIEESHVKIEKNNLPELIADTTQMIQVFQNIILNAIKFKGDADPEIQIDAQPVKTENKQEWQFSIRDNGIGIEPDYHEKAFELFKRIHLRSEVAGEGMGLSICKKIIERHGGRIWLESEGKNTGTTVYFMLSDIQPRP